jgi:hypothetical protein
MLNVHSLGNVAWHCAGCKGASEDGSELIVKATNAQLCDVKVLFEQPLHAVITLDLQKRLSRLEGDLRVWGKLSDHGVGITPRSDRDDLLKYHPCCIQQPS